MNTKHRKDDSLMYGVNWIGFIGVDFADLGELLVNSRPPFLIVEVGLELEFTGNLALCLTVNKRCERRLQITYHKCPPGTELNAHLHVRLWTNLDENIDERDNVLGALTRCFDGFSDLFIGG